MCLNQSIPPRLHHNVSLDQSGTTNQQKARVKALQVLTQPPLYRAGQPSKSGISNLVGSRVRDRCLILLFDHLAPRKSARVHPSRSMKHLRGKRTFKDDNAFCTGDGRKSMGDNETCRPTSLKYFIDRIVHLSQRVPLSILLGQTKYCRSHSVFGCGIQ